MSMGGVNIRNLPFLGMRKTVRKSDGRGGEGESRDVCHLGSGVVRMVVTLSRLASRTAISMPSVLWLFTQRNNYQR